MKNESLKNRVDHSNREIDRLSNQSSQVDKDSRTGRETLLMEKFQLEKDLGLSQNQLKVKSYNSLLFNR